jgi:hypothetical protein
MGKKISTQVISKLLYKTGAAEKSIAALVYPEEREKRVAFNTFS